MIFEPATAWTAAFQFLRGGGAGAAAGFASGLLGVSSGGILVPAICLMMGVDQRLAQGISLIAQVPPTSLAASIYYRRHSATVFWKRVGQLSAGFIAGGVFGALTAQHVSTPILRWLFVSYLILLAALSLRPRKTKDQDSEAGEDHAPSWIAFCFIGLAGGYSSGLLGIGGGLAITALSVALFRFSQHKAQALSLAMTALPLTAPSAMVYIFDGKPLPWIAIGGLVIGLVVGSAAGGMLANRLPERVLKPTFTVLILTMAAFMAMRR